MYARTTHLAVMSKNSVRVERYEYDAMGRRTLAILTNGGSEEADVRYYYTAAGRLTRESQQVQGGDARNVDMLYNKVASRTRLAYPGASQVMNYTYDALNRISLIKDGANVINEYKYVGPQRVSERKYVKASDGSARGAMQCETNERRPIEWVAVPACPKGYGAILFGTIVACRGVAHETPPLARRGRDERRGLKNML